jgi:hypothetical protein
VVPPIGTPLLAGSTAPRAATLELVPNSLDSAPPGAVFTAPRRVPAVPPGFLPHAAPVTPVASRAAPETLVAPRAAPAPPASFGPPPRVWPASPIAYVRRPRRPAAPALLTSMPTHRPVTAVPVSPLVNPHRMVIRAKAGFWMPREPLVLTATTTTAPPSPILTSVHAALADPNWRVAMEEEYGTLLSNRTWDLVPRPRGSNVVTGKWLFIHKSLSDRTFDRYKAR